MTGINDKLARQWARIGTRFLPFADAATQELPLGRLLRLSLFQVSVGMALVLLNGTLNRVMIVELAVPASLVAAMVSLPILFAPVRALLGFRSDHYRSVLGWRRVPFIWLGTMLQFGGLSILPFALILLSGDSNAPQVVGHIASALAFLLIGAGLHTTQTAGIALATDLAAPDRRHRVIALLYVMLLVGMVVSALFLSAALEAFSQVRLIQVIQGAAVFTMVVNIVALWKQEARDPARTATKVSRPFFVPAVRQVLADGRFSRLLVAVALGTAGFAMQDILLEPYGAKVFGLSVSQTTRLNVFQAGGMLVGFAYAARKLDRQHDPLRLAAFGALVGIVALSTIIFSAPLNSAELFKVGVACMGFSSGLFAVGALTATVARASDESAGLVVGVWGGVQATAAGLAIAIGGLLSDLVGTIGSQGMLGQALVGPASGFMVVYHIEIALLFASLIAIGPLVRSHLPDAATDRSGFGLTEYPG